MSMPMLCIMALGIVQPNAVEISARIDATDLHVGQSYTLTLNWDIASNSSVDQAGIPVPLIQIDVPKSVELVGKVLNEHKELAKNEFLRAPFERALESKSSNIDFKLIAAPKDSDQIAINFIAYATLEDGSVRFIRKRIAVPVIAEGGGKEVAIGDASWGDNSLVKIGEKVKGVSLPQADGTQVDLGEMIGKSNIVLTTYRAFW
ncbi:MAG TPA: hypothetical protein PKN33_12145 [Phycisphaerae bacterium]|nr:hypothetical protein [Phycisphaerae bacterium]